MKEKKVVREERNKEKLTSGDWVMAEFYSIHSLKSSRMHAVIDEFKKLMGGKVEVVQVNVDEHPNQVMRIAERILTDKERKLWEQSGMNASELLRIWTRKESYAKREGRGLSIGLESVDTTENAFYQERQLKDDYYMTVCTAHESEPMQVFDLTDRL